jgi:hypothetical protein
MKRILMTAVFLSMTSLSVHAEPVFMPQAASVVKQKQLETGVDVQYGYEKSELASSPGTTFLDRTMTIPFWARYGIMDNLESHLLVPFVHAIDSSEGVSSFHNEDGGLGNMQVGAKWNFKSAPMPLALGVDLDLPTANSANNVAATGWRYSNQIQQGFNAHLFLAADTPVYNDLLSGHAMLGYMNTATYTTATGTRFNPSDLFTFGASVDLDLKKWVNGLTASGEMVGNTALTHSRTNSTVNGGNDMGQVLEAGPALRYQLGAWRTKAGVMVDAGPATYRAYNYRYLLGVSYLFGGSH